MKRLVIVEDQTAIREMLAEIIRIDNQFQLVGECGDGQAAFQLCLDIKPDVLILDVKLPGLNGVELLRKLSKRLPQMRVLVFSGHENPVLVRSILEAGAHGFVEKTAGLVEVRRGLEQVAGGGTYFGPAVTELMSAVLNRSGSRNSPDSLTDREREILKLVVESNTSKAIGEKLGIASKTVDNHRSNLMKKLKVRDIAGLTRYAVEVGIIETKQLA